MEIRTEEIIDFLLIFVRAGIAMTLLPVFGSRNVPATFRIAFIISFSFLLTPVMDIKISQGDIPLLMISEFLAGMVLGIIARTVFLVAEIAGQVISNTVGLSMATIFDPEAGHSTEISRLFWILSLFIFFTSGIYRDIIYIFVKSYEIVPPGRLYSGDIVKELIPYGGTIITTALKMASGVVVVMFAVNIVMGFISRAVPQMNVFFVAYPFYIGLGLFVMLVSLPAYIYFYNTSFDAMKEELMKSLYLMRR
ncbi:MAG: flagellar biosynthetic protein FliR [Thermodesulfovibrionales bacterium]|nr:flagellar biosynthetic protein FliR [Thermodesulfovibrionales bacterium]